MSSGCRGFGGGRAEMRASTSERNERYWSRSDAVESRVRRTCQAAGRRCSGSSGMPASRRDCQHTQCSLETAQSSPHRVPSEGEHTLSTQPAELVLPPGFRTPRTVRRRRSLRRNSGRRSIARAADEAEWSGSGVERLEERLEALDAASVESTVSSREVPPPSEACSPLEMALHRCWIALPTHERLRWVV